MGWKLLFLFFAVAAAFDEDYPDSYNPDCLESVYRECDLELIDSDVEFPETKEELQAVCKMISDYAACSVKILDSCRASDEIAKPIHTAKKVFENICDESSKLNEVIVQNLECVADNLDYFGQPCPLSPEETQDLNDIINTFSAADEDAFQNADLCMQSLTRIGCAASKLGDKCGKDAVDALIEILQQVEKPFERCGPAVKENLPLIIGILDTEEELAEDLQEMKKRKR